MELFGVDAFTIYFQASYRLFFFLRAIVKCLAGLCFILYDKTESSKKKLYLIILLISPKVAFESDHV